VGKLISSRHFNTYEVIGEVRCPVLVVHGVEDKTVPVEHSRILATRISKDTKSLFKECPNIGHGTGKTFCEDVLPTMRTFLEETT
jgi:dipeptidyl aminopeptidase/acylaminoacyl peptidase